MSEALFRYDARLHAYCWMTNHIHLPAQVADVPLGRLMQTVSSRYARLFQSRLQTTGHLFERRYHAVLVDADDQLLQSIRYIHLNPVSAGIVSDPRSYRWSSHAAYCGSGGPAWLTTDCALAIFDEDRSRARAAYDRFIRDAVENERTTAIDDGPELPGASTSFGAIPNVADIQRSWRSLDELIGSVCEEAGVTADVLAVRHRSRVITEVRARIAGEAVRSGLATLEQLAGYFGCSAAAISRLLQRRTKRGQEQQLALRGLASAPSAKV
jgi:REP element-mobilizing transposase RayT